MTNNAETPEENKEPRKASDVLLSLEEKVNNLIKIISVYDINIKLILDRVNKMHAYIEKLQLEYDFEKEQLDKLNGSSLEPKIVNSPQEIINISDKPILNKRTIPIQQQEQVVLKEEKQPIPSTATNANSSDRKVPIIQRITDNNGKDLFMAEVSIMNENKELFSKTKTNAAGKWQAYLKPGKYLVHIAKTDSATKKKLECMQEVNISDNDTTITLPTAIIKR